MHAVRRLLAVDAASVKLISVRFYIWTVIFIKTGIITRIVRPPVVIAIFPGRIHLLIIVVSASVSVIVISPVGLIIVCSVSRVILSIVVSWIIIVLGVFCIIITIGTSVCSVVILRIALPG